MLWYLCLFIPLAYLSFMVFSLKKWKAIHLPITLQNTEKFSVSVIIPTRNEEKNIIPLLNDLIKQVNAPQFEVIVVDDHSSDDTNSIVNKFIEKHESINLKLLNLDATEGKKYAVEKGVECASGSVILCTDADCRVDPSWIKTMTNPFHDNEINLVFGVVAVSGKGFFNHFQSYELSFLNAIGAVSSSMGQPGMINAANMAYRKEVFLHVDGYKENIHIPSGDDEFLLAKVQNKFPKSVIFNNRLEALVHTQPQKSLLSLLMQKKRWAGKWNMHQKKWPALVVLLLNVYFFSLLLGVSFNIMPVELAVTSFYLKLIGELLLLWEIRIRYNLGINLLNFVVSSLLYPVYAVIIGISANLGSYSWKERNYRVKQKL